MNNCSKTTNHTFYDFRTILRLGYTFLKLCVRIAFFDELCSSHSSCQRHYFYGSTILSNKAVAISTTTTPTLRCNCRYDHYSATRLQCDSTTTTYYYDDSDYYYYYDLYGYYTATAIRHDYYDDYDDEYDYDDDYYITMRPRSSCSLGVW